jgi:hypothetical protein
MSDRTVLGLLEIAEEQHQLISEQIELLAIGHKIEPEDAQVARSHQARVGAVLARLRRILTNEH